jgi:hypothetical protein
MPGVLEPASEAEHGVARKVFIVATEPCLGLFREWWWLSIAGTRWVLR